jgi:mercuric ion transport protein
MEKTEEPQKARIGRISFVFLSVLFVLCIVGQVFLAGLAVFVNPGNWPFHEMFVHLFEFIPILMVVMSLVGRLPRWAIWQSAGLFGLIFVMYFTANMTSVLPWAAAAHPVVAVLLFWISVTVMKRAWRTKVENA